MTTTNKATLSVFLVMSVVSCSISSHLLNSLILNNTLYCMIAFSYCVAIAAAAAAITEYCTIYPIIYFFH